MSESRRVSRGMPPPPRASSPRVRSAAQTTAPRSRSGRESFGSPSAWASPIMPSTSTAGSSHMVSSMHATIDHAAPEEQLSGREQALQQQLLYTQDVLRKYKSYVESRVMEQLRQSQRAVEALQSDHQRSQREKDSLVAALHAKTAELEARTRTDSELSEKQSRDLQQLSSQHTRDAAATERLHADEVAALRQTIDGLKNDVAQTQALQVALNRRDDEVKKLRQSLAETSNRTAWAHNDHAALSECFSDVKQASLELQDFFATAATAVREQLARTTTLVDSGAMGDLDPQSCELPALDHFSAASGIASASHDARGGSAQQAAKQIKALREQLYYAQQQVVVMLKVELQAHNAAVDAYEAALAQLEAERALARRRMEELEDDRRQDRQRMSMALEESKLKSVLSQATPSQLIRGAASSNNRASANAAALSPVPSSLANGVLDVASVLLATQPQSPQRRVRQASTGVQTALEVSVFALPAQQTASSAGGGQAALAVSSSTGGAGSPAASMGGVSTMTYNRVLNEVARLQEDNQRLSQSVALLDAQRRRFLGFVNDGAISEHIEAALRGGSLIDLM